MQNEKVLLVGGWHLNYGLNHQIRHMAAYFKKQFQSIDIVGYKTFYDGPPAPRFTRARKGIQNLLNSRINITGNNSSRLINIRDLYAPVPLDMPFGDIWHIINLIQVLTPPYDVAIIGYPGNAWLAWFLKKSGWVKRLVYYDYDFHPGFTENCFAKRWLENRERLFSKNSDAIITVNPLLAKLRMEQGARQVWVIPNGVDLKLFAKARQKMHHPPTLVFTGNLSNLWGLDLAIKAMPAISKHIPNIRLLIAGYGPAEADLKMLSRSLNVEDRVIFMGRFEYQDLPSILAQADVGIATSLPDSLFRYYASPLKLIDYMAAGLPVIASRVGYTINMMQESNAGILIEHSVEQFTNAAVSLISDQKLQERYAQSAIAYATNFDWDLLMEKAFQYVIGIMEKDRVSPNINTSN